MRSVLVLLGSGFLVLSCLAHGLLGWKSVGGALRAAGTPPDLMADVAAVWSYSSTAMGAFGIIGLIAGVRLRTGDRSGLTALRVIAAAYVLYGLAAFVGTGFDPHFLMLFIVPGLVIAAGSR